MRAFLIVLFLAFAVVPAKAWNWEGHQIVALIGEAHLSPFTKSEVSRLLALEGKRSMADVSSWADSVKELSVPRQPMHTVRIPLDLSPYSESRDCKNKNCALAAIEAGIDLLSDGAANDEAKLLALKYLIHLVGDIHQPLHSSIDTGGRNVDFKGKVQTLHRIWDRQIIRTRRVTVSDLAVMVNKSENGQPYGGKPADWAIESRDIARDEILAGLPSDDTNAVTRLPDDYADRNWPIVERRLALAGLRLSLILNRAFSQSPN